MATKNSIVIDNGAGKIKSGFSTEDKPKSIMQTLVGYAKPNNDLPEVKEVYIGESIKKYRKDLNLKYPIERGIIKDWEIMENIWKYIFSNELLINTSEQPIFITESPLLHPTINKEKMLTILFEKFDFPKVYVANSSLMSLYGTGRTTGIIIDSGEGVTSAIPVYDGFLMNHSMSKILLAGSDVTSYLSTLCNKQGYNLNMNSELELIREIKEKYAFINCDDDLKVNKNEEQPKLTQTFELPDKSLISISNERFLCTEILFNPSLIDKDTPSIPNLVVHTILKCDLELRPEFYKNIILSGGNTIFEGFTKRLETEIRKQIPSSLPLKIMDEGFKLLIGWQGASVLSSLSSFQEEYITKKEYQENGTKIASKKCL